MEEPPAEEPPKEEPKKEEPPPPPPLGPLPVVPMPAPTETQIDLRAQPQVVNAGAHASLIATVSPCVGRTGERVFLNRGGHRVASRPLGEDCSARFEPRVGRRATFRVRVPGGTAYLPGRSKRVTVFTRRER